MVYFDGVRVDTMTYLDGVRVDVLEDAGVLERLGWYDGRKWLRRHCFVFRDGFWRETFRRFDGDRRGVLFARVRLVLLFRFRRTLWGDSHALPALAVVRVMSKRVALLVGATS